MTRRPVPSRAVVRVLAIGLLVAAGLACFAPAAGAARWTWSGATVMDYMRLYHERSDERLSKQGANVEASLKATVELSEQVTAQVRLCTSCHGLMMDQAYAEIRLAKSLALEAGRIPVPFGDFYLRSDPSSDVFMSKPLPYSMGHMLRYQSDRFNLGVLPMPYPDNGAALTGDVWFRDEIQVWYGLYGVNGFRSESPRDFTFLDQVSVAGFNDNNHDVSWGGRLAVARGNASAGGSYLRGAYDPDARFDFSAWGLDAAVEVRRVRLKAEYLSRATDVSDAGARRTLRKSGFYGQAEVPVHPRLSLVGRLDGLLREGPKLGTDNDDVSAVVRWTAGANLSPAPDYALRFQYEHWRFTDFRSENLLHLGVLVTY